MIFDKLPKQTQSQGPHTRLYGCKAHTGAAMVADFLGKTFTAHDIWQWIIEAIGKGYITDTSSTWVTVNNPSAWMRLVGNKLGERIKAVEVYRGEPNLQAILAHPAASYCEVEWYMKKYGHNPDHVHFTLGEYAGGIMEKTYDPWPGLDLGDVKTIRLWEITREA